MRNGLKRKGTQEKIEPQIEKFYEELKARGYKRTKPAAIPGRDAYVPSYISTGVGESNIPEWVTGKKYSMK